MECIFVRNFKRNFHIHNHIKMLRESPATVVRSTADTHHLVHLTPRTQKSMSHALAL